MQAVAELRTLRAVVVETKKLEECEARLVGRIEELKQGAVKVGGGDDGARSRWDTNGASMPRAAVQPREETGGSPRSIISKVTGGIRPRRFSERREQTAEVESGPPPELEASSPHPTSSHSTSEPWGVIAAGVSHSDPPPVPPHTSFPTTSSQTNPPYTVSTHTAHHRTTLCPLSTVPTLAATPFDGFSMALLAQLLPSQPLFSGEQPVGNGENFSEWLEIFELVASARHWDDQAKLVNIATRLHGSASRFYWSCTSQRRSSYKELTDALRSRFIPVQIQSVQSSRFHERKQGPKELVDEYAQDQQRLFHRAYAETVHTEGVQAMGLRYQFVAGLHAGLKAKVVGCPGP